MRMVILSDQIPLGKLMYRQELHASTDSGQYA